MADFLQKAKEAASPIVSLQAQASPSAFETAVNKIEIITPYHIKVDHKGVVGMWDHYLPPNLTPTEAKAYGEEKLFAERPLAIHPSELKDEAALRQKIGFYLSRQNRPGATERVMQEISQRAMNSGGLNVLSQQADRMISHAREVMLSFEKEPLLRDLIPVFAADSEHRMMVGDATEGFKRDGKNLAGSYLFYEKTAWTTTADIFPVYNSLDTELEGDRIPDEERPGYRSVRKITHANTMGEELTHAAYRILGEADKTGRANKAYNKDHKNIKKIDHHFDEHQSELLTLIQQRREETGYQGEKTNEQLLEGMRQDARRIIDPPGYHPDKTITEALAKVQNFHMKWGDTITRKFFPEITNFIEQEVNPKARDYITKSQPSQRQHETGVSRR